MSHLVLPSVDGYPAIEYRVLDGQPQVHQITIQRRTLRPAGDKYHAGEWRTLCAGDLRRQVRLNGPVAEWLRTKTRVDLSAAQLAAYADEEPAHLHCCIPTLATRHNRVA